ncbi:carbonic anhydrase [Halobaculum sp. CBA1158]|uniref:beta-class carbonic anhydrase n=1 Tax=Halobaculum sp. CBA1158 TaxID=2904243 RepID=UPI001F34DA9D|nr:carbonic anhydrase [Halobaculum sp. CBA1158]UIO99342.1 carbonic anhydrase [Halobaculum sp. CBA1158]
MSDTDADTDTGTDEHGHEHDHVHERVDEAVDARDDWARRRRKGIPTDENLLVVACMDERIPVEDALDLDLGDAQIYRNAGGKVTDDVIRSAALTTNFFDTDEIVVVNHTDCGMMSASDDDVAAGLEARAEAAGVDLDDVDLDPALPELDIGDAAVEEWVRMTDNIDEACAAQVRYLEEHELIPEDVTVSGYVYEVESGELRRPGERVAEEISERRV